MNGWWRERSVREQRLLLLMTALFVAVMLWLAIVRPLAAALDRARHRQAAAVTALAAVREQATALEALRKSMPTRPTTPIATFVGGQARAAGFSGFHVAAAGDERATITIDAVRPQAFFGWIARLEREQGLVVDSLSARANSDATLTVEARLRVAAS